MSAWCEFRARFGAAGWFEEVLLYESSEDLRPGVRRTTEVYCVKVGIVLMAVGLVGALVCFAWSVVG